jgi:peptide/nickel transport system permease protein
VSVADVAAPRTPRLQRARRLTDIAGRLGVVPAIALLIIATFVLTALLADFVSPHDPLATSLRDRLRPPSWLSGGSSQFILGTDVLGRDVLSRLIHGARTSLLVAALALTVGGGIGLLVALASGYFAGRVDTILMRLVDMMLALPIILLALIFAVTLGSSTQNVVLAIALVLWARFARVIRGDVLVLRSAGFVELARISGASHARIIGRHILPNIANTALVMASVQVGFVIIVEASLSFLGAGVPVPTPAWGSMIAEGREYVTTAWWLTVWPGVATMFLVMAFNFFGDWLRDELDPRLSQL